MRAIDLFAGPGGWDEGLRPLGIAPLGIEWDAAACETRVAAGHPTLQADVAELDPLDFAPCDLLVASPPCQAFSAAGKGDGHKDVPLILRVAREMGDPRVFQPGGHHGEGKQSQNAVRVTLQEASILQSFRPDYPWQGSRTKQFEQVGNAVPPLLARAVIVALLEAAVDERPVHQPLCPDAPIPGGPHHYSGCSDDRPRVNPDGRCEDCGGHACPDCGLEGCDCERPA